MQSPFFQHQLVLAGVGKIDPGWVGKRLYNKIKLDKAGFCNNLGIDAIVYILKDDPVVCFTIGCPFGRVASKKIIVILAEWNSFSYRYISIGAFKFHPVAMSVYSFGSAFSVAYFMKSLFVNQRIGESFSGNIQVTTGNICLEQYLGIPLSLVFDELNMVRRNNRLGAGNSIKHPIAGNDQHRKQDQAV